MTSRKEILNAIRGHDIPPVELPKLDGPWIEYPDRKAQFAEVLETIGGTCLTVDGEAGVAGAITDREEFSSATKIFSQIEGIENANIDLAAIEDPHALTDVDYAIIRGEFCVAENGAVWVTDEEIRHRVIYFSAQHLVLVVSSKNIVDNMHQAYERLQFSEPRFGVFVAGPSKTADIEQSLVIGAQGPRSQVVVLVG